MVIAPLGAKLKRGLLLSLLDLPRGFSCRKDVFRRVLMSLNPGVLSGVLHGMAGVPSGGGGRRSGNRSAGACRPGLGQYRVFRALASNRFEISFKRLDAEMAGNRLDLTLAKAAIRAN